MKTEFELLKNWDKIILGLHDLKYSVTFNEIDKNFKIYNDSYSVYADTVAEVGIFLEGLNIESSIHSDQLSAKQTSINHQNAQINRLNSKVTAACNALSDLRQMRTLKAAKVHSLNIVNKLMED